MTESNIQSDTNGLKRTPEASAAALADLLGPWADGADPLNEQLADALVRAVERGLLPPGTRLPAERELARQLGLSRSTIVAAYDRLRASGMIRSRQGSGTRVAPRRPGLAQPLDAGGGPGRWTAGAAIGAVVETAAPGRPVGLAVPMVDDAIPLTIGALPAVPGVAEAVEQAMREDVPALLADVGYDPFGLPALRDAVAMHLARLGVPTDPDQVLITSGAQQAVHLISTQLAGPDAAVAIENPTYIGAVDAFRTSGSRLLPIPMDEDGAMVDVIPLLTSGGPIRLAYVIPTFHNPTGATMPDARRRRLAHLASDLGFLIVEDLSPDFAYDQGTPPPIAAFDRADRVVTVGSLSKLAWGGLRIGWIRAPRHAIDRLVAGKIVVDHSTSLITQAVAVRVFQRLDAVAAASRAAATERRALLIALLAERLPDWSFSVPDGGLSLWVRIGDADALEFARSAVRHGVIVRAGPLASPDGGFRDHIRIAYGVEPEQLREGVDRLATAWAAYAPAGRADRASIAVSV